MRETNSSTEELENALREARCTLADVEPILPGANRRIAVTSIKPARRIGSPFIVLAVLLLGVALIFVLHRNSPRTAIVAKNGTNPDAVFTMQLDNVEITAHVAAVMERRAVVIVWSSKGQIKSDAIDAQTPIRIAKYRRYFLQPAKLPDGQPAAICLFIADEGVKPVLEPPMVFSDLGTGRAIAFSVSPQTVSDSELPQTLCSAGLSNGAAIATDIAREIHKHLNE